MTLKDAKVLRDKIKAWGAACIVPLGHGPDGYFCRIFCSAIGERVRDVDFHSPEEFHAHADMRARERADRDARDAMLSRPRSPTSQSD